LLTAQFALVNTGPAVSKLSMCELYRIFRNRLRNSVISTCGWTNRSICLALCVVFKENRPKVIKLMPVKKKSKRNPPLTGFGCSVSSSDKNREMIKLTSIPELRILKSNYMALFLKSFFTKQSQLQDGKAGRNTEKPRVTPFTCLSVN